MYTNTFKIINKSGGFDSDMVFKETSLTKLHEWKRATLINIAQCKQKILKAKIDQNKKTEWFRKVDHARKMQGLMVSLLDTRISQLKVESLSNIFYELEDNLTSDDLLLVKNSIKYHLK